MEKEDIVIAIRDFLRSDTQLKTFVWERIYFTRPKDVAWNFILLRDVSNFGVDDILDEIIALEVIIIGKDTNMSYNDLLPISKRLKQVLHWYNLTLWTFTPYKWLRVNWPLQWEEGWWINSLICDFKFYYVI